MNKSFNFSRDEKPLAISFGYFEKTNLCFITKRGILRIEKGNQQKLIINLLKQCTGLTTVDEIKKNSALSHKNFDEIFKFLSKHEIIVPSTKLWNWFHERTLDDTKYHADFNHSLFKKLKSPQRANNKMFSKDKLTRLEKIQINRKSIRAFQPLKITKRELKRTLASLYFSSGVPTVPSEGEFYPLKFFVVSLNTQLATGIYQYMLQTTGLELIAPILDSDELFFALQERKIFEKASYIVVVCANLSIHPQKYSNRGYRYSLMEVGSVIQNAYLYGADIGRGVLAYGGFSDTTLKKMLKLDNDTFPLITLAFGGLQKDSFELECDQMPVYALNSLLKTYAEEDEIIQGYATHTLYYKNEEILTYCASSSYKSSKKTKGKERNGTGFGVGYSKGEAALKAVAESLERYFSGEFFFSKEGSLSNISSAMNPNDFWTYLNILAQKKFSHFDVHTSYRWVEGRYIKNGKKTFLLADQVFYPLNKKILGYTPVYKTSSSGVAAHSNKKKATERALLELIERDAIALVWYGKNPITKLSKKHLPQNLQAKQKEWAKRSFVVEFYNITADSIPVVLCCFRNKKEFPFLVFGAGADYLLTTALEKAFSEAQYAMLAWRQYEGKRVRKKDIQHPLDHGLFYAQKINAEFPLKELKLKKKNAQNKAKRYTYNKLISKFNPIKIVLHLDPQVSVVRVMSSKLTPLNFGYGMEGANLERFQEMGLEFKNTEPHFFP